MSTILEAFKKFGVELPTDILAVSSEDLPYLMFATLMPGAQKEINTFGLMVAMAIRIEQLENENFELRWPGKEEDDE